MYISEREREAEREGETVREILRQRQISLKSYMRRVEGH